jgi:hypothetical protein
VLPGVAAPDQLPWDEHHPVQCAWDAWGVVRRGVVVDEFPEPLRDEDAGKWVGPVLDAQVLVGSRQDDLQSAVPALLAVPCKQVSARSEAQSSLDQAAAAVQQAVEPAQGAAEQSLAERWVAPH